MGKEERRMKVFEEYIIPINETAKDYDEMFVGIIRRQPKLIRCKECRFRDQFGFCRRWLWQNAPKMDDDEYCSGAEACAPCAPEP